MKRCQAMNNDKSANESCESSDKHAILTDSEKKLDESARRKPC